MLASGSSTCIIQSILPRHYSQSRRAAALRIAFLTHVLRTNALYITHL